MKDKNTQMWIPLYVDKWIFGSTRIELEPAERGVFVDLMAFGAKDKGFIRANETTAYPHTQLAGLLNIPVGLLDSTIVKCLHFEKLIESDPGIYRLKNWDEYQLSKSYISELENGVKPMPGLGLRTKSSQERTKGSTIREEKREEDKIRGDEPKRTGFASPTLQMVKDYCRERGNSVNPDHWLAHYQSNGWRVGRNPMKDWKAAVRTWERGEFVLQSKPAAPGKAIYDSPAPAPITDPTGWEPLK